MRGTGTAEDPYIVDNWADFSAIYSANVYIEWDEDASEKIVDFNEIFPAGTLTTISISAKIKFNGWEFRNLYSRAESMIGFVTMNATTSGFILKNFVWEPPFSTSASVVRTMLKSNGSQNRTILNCVFSGRLNLLNESNIVTNYIKINACGFNLEINSNSRFVFAKMEMINSDIVLDAHVADFSLNTVNVNNCRITGRILSQGIISLGGPGSAYNVYNLVADKPLLYSGNGISIYNSDTAISSDDMEEIESPLKGCTAEQMTDVSYLQDIGFPVESGE